MNSFITIVILIFCFPLCSISDDVIKNNPDKVPVSNDNQIRFSAPAVNSNSNKKDVVSEKVVPPKSNRQKKRHKPSKPKEHLSIPSSSKMSRSEPPKSLLNIHEKLIKGLAEGVGEIFNSSHLAALKPPGLPNIFNVLQLPPAITNLKPPGILEGIYKKLTGKGKNQENSHNGSKGINIGVLNQFINVPPPAALIPLFLNMTRRLIENTYEPEVQPGQPETSTIAPCEREGVLIKIWNFISSPLRFILSLALTKALVDLILKGLDRIINRIRPRLCGKIIKI